MSSPPASEASFSSLMLSSHSLFPSEMTTTDPTKIRETHKTHFKAMPEGERPWGSARF